jgi:hypothetical protein
MDQQLLLLNTLSIGPLSGMAAFASNEVLSLAIILVAASMAFGAYTGGRGKVRVAGLKVTVAFMSALAHLALVLVAVGSVPKERVTGSRVPTRALLMAVVLAATASIIWQYPGVGLSPAFVSGIVVLAYGLAAVWMGETFSRGTWTVLFVLLGAYIVGSLVMPEHRTFWPGLRIVAVAAVYLVMKSSGLAVGLR